MFRNRRMFRNLFVARSPTNKNIKQWLPSVDDSSNQILTAMQPSGGKPLWNGLPVRKVIAYVAASREVCALKHMQIARQKIDTSNTFCNKTLMRIECVSVSTGITVFCGRLGSISIRVVACSCGNSGLHWPSSRSFYICKSLHHRTGRVSSSLQRRLT